MWKLRHVLSNMPKATEMGFEPMLVHFRGCALSYFTTLPLNKPRSGQQSIWRMLLHWIVVTRNTGTRRLGEGTEEGGGQKWGRRGWEAIEIELWGTGRRIQLVFQYIIYFGLNHAPANLGHLLIAKMVMIWSTQSHVLIGPSSWNLLGGHACPSLPWLHTVFGDHSPPDGASQMVLVYHPICQCGRHKRWEFDPWIWKIPWKRAWQPTPIFLPGESHGQRSLAGYSPWGYKESDTTEHTTIHTTWHLNRQGPQQSRCQVFNENSSLTCPELLSVLILLA